VVRTTTLCASGLAALFGLALVSAGAAAEPPAGGGHAAQLVTDLMPGKLKLTVTSPGFKDGGDIPFKYTQYQGNIFPGVAWSKGPPATQSYVVIMQGVLGHGTSIHLNLFNVPADVSALKTGLKEPPAGALYGASLHGVNQGYVGPHTHNFGKQKYYLQVLALDTRLPDSVQPSFPALEAAMSGHVLASGEILGIGTMDPNSPEATELRQKQAQGKAPASAQGKAAD
jgi:para-nitrobenzyl esterase